MEKEKAFYSEVEHFYRNRVTKFLPIANGILEKFGFEVGQVQLNDSCFRTDEFSLTPSDVDPSRNTLEKGVKSDVLRKLLAGKGIHKYEGVLEEVADNLGIDDKTYDYSHLEGHNLIPVIFVRPKGSSIRFSDLIPIEDLYYYDFYPIRGVKEEIPDDWGRDVWDQFDLVLCLQGEEERSPGELPNLDSPEFSFYWVLSKSASWVVNVSLLEALFELDISKSSSKESLNLGIGEVISRREISITPLVVIALPKNRGDAFPSKDDVGKLILSLRSALASSSSIIVNDKVRSIFRSGLEEIISESLKVLFLTSTKDFVVPGANLKLTASSPEEVELAINEVFEKFGEAYELIDRKGLVYKVDGVYSKSPMYTIHVEPFNSGFKDFPNPTSPPKESLFSTLLSSLNGIEVEESYFTHRSKLTGHRVYSNRNQYREETEIVVKLVAVGPKPLTPEDLEEEGEESFNITYSPNDLVISENPLPPLLGYLNPSLDPRFSLHTYLLPLVPALLYYGYTLILSQGFKVKSRATVFVASSFSPKGRSTEDGELEDAFTKAFSRRVLDLSDHFLRNVWEGILEDRHKKYLEASENFLKVVSPKEDRVSTSVLYKKYSYRDSLSSSLTFNLVVKYRQSEEFLSSLKDLIVQAVLLLSEIGVGVEVGITFVY